MKTVGAYEYDEKNEVGRGAFGVVYKGCHRTNLAEVVAIKEVDVRNYKLKYLHDTINREATILETLSNPRHKNIVALFHFEQQEHLAYFVMEFYNGGSLQEYLQSKQKLEENTIRHFLKQIAHGLKAAHEMQIIHRDLKPENILLCFFGHKYPSPGNITLKIADFGIGRFLNLDEMASTNCGTPLYMAPEICYQRRGGYEYKADLWSVGVIAYECHVGSLEGYSLSDLHDVKIPQNISPEFANLLSGLLNKDENKRFDMNQFFYHQFLTATMSVSVVGPGNQSKTIPVIDKETMSSDPMDADKMLSEQMEAEKMYSKPLDGDKISPEPMKEDDAMQDDDEKYIGCDVCKANSDDQTTQVPLPTASKRCMECQQNLCSRCSIEHRRQKLLKSHHIVDFPCQVRENTAESSQSNAKAKADYSKEPMPCEDHDSDYDSSGCFPTTHAQHQTSVMKEADKMSSDLKKADKMSSDLKKADIMSSDLKESDKMSSDLKAYDSSASLPKTHAQHQTNGTVVMAQITRERDRLKEYEAEMSSHIDQLLKGQDDINTMADNITKMIDKKHSECLARLESDKKSLLKQLNSVREETISENDTKLQEAISYLQKIADRRTNLEEILNKGSVEANDEFTKSLLLHVYFQRPMPTLANVSFHESFSWTGTDNVLGRLEGLINISKTQTEPTLRCYMKFLRDVYSRTTDAMEIRWRMTMPNEVEMKNLYDFKILQGIRNELELSRDDKKWDELQATHVKLASYLQEVTRPISESTSEKPERQLTDLQRNIGKLWNTIQFHIHYKNSERGLIPEGFQNYGNACYFNSVLQCLLQTVLLPFQLTVNLYGLENVFTEKKEMSCLSKAFMQLTSRYSDSEQNKEALTTLYYTFTGATQRFSDQRQHDSHDLLIHFLDKLRVEERNAWKSSSPGPQTQKMLTAVDRIFGGQFITVITCHSCQEPYAIREPFLDISIPPSVWNDTSDDVIALGAVRTYDAESQQKSLVDDGNCVENYFSSETDLSSPSAINKSGEASSRKDVINNMLQPITVEASVEPKTKTFWSRVFKASNPNVSQCLKYFTRAEAIDSEYLCRNCQTPESDELRMTSATKRTLISSPPAILVLHLKRFEQTPIGFIKRDDMISYDELLDMGPFCSCSALRIDPEEENIWYSLYAVVVHRGRFLSQGHYVAYIKQRNSSAQLDDQLREMFLQKNFGDWEKVPNDDDLAAMEWRKAIKKREKAKSPNPIPGKWFYVRDDSVRPCDAKEALDQQAFLLFYERIPGTDHKSSGV